MRQTRTTAPPRILRGAHTAQLPTRPHSVIARLSRAAENFLVASRTPVRMRSPSPTVSAAKLSLAPVPPSPPLCGHRTVTADTPVRRKSQLQRRLADDSLASCRARRRECRVYTTWRLTEPNLKGFRCGQTVAHRLPSTAVPSPVPFLRDILNFNDGTETGRVCPSPTRRNDGLARLRVQVLQSAWQECIASSNPRAKRKSARVIPGAAKTLWSSPVGRPTSGLVGRCAGMGGVLPSSPRSLCLA
ncbi:hypothetical protein GGX14DRAFT_582904 [Mycena pura]|uniref:Uncharacterized protein n=1 Tax=Mycena pura TaxID=153505 RepID=A0AAD6YVX9_9AGAR|nr:hypothetical protein GGX14DRAFT_582904 [Mycena pura]